LSKKIIVIIFIVILLFAGIIALTQELDINIPGLINRPESDNGEEEEQEDDSYDFIKPAVWFRSNAGGMPLEELPSQYVALRGEYALAIDIVDRSDLPGNIIQYFHENYYAEIRTLYRNNELIRTQWIFRDHNGNTRFNSVLIEPINEPKEMENSKTEEEQTPDTKSVRGFMEIFDEKTNLTREYRFFEDGRRMMIEYEYNNNALISSRVSLMDKETEGQYRAAYKDTYIYNRSSSLRAIERDFYADMQLSSDDPLRVIFPRHLRDAIKDRNFISERLNIYPDFFGDTSVSENSKMVFETDDRSRILSQTLYDDTGEIIWFIQNTWLNNRIISSVKNEGDDVFLSEFEYDSNGDKILERNYKNDVLERVVRVDGSLEYEELYMNDTIVLQAVWEDGRKISETRMR